MRLIMSVIFMPGLQLKLNIAPHVDLVVEPLLTLYSDGIDNYTKTNWHKYDVGYGAMMGFSYRLSENNKVSDTNKDDKNSFVSIAAGGQYQFSNATKEIGILKTMGPDVQISGGKWFKPFLGMRASAFWGTNAWNRHFIYDERDENIIGETKLKEMYMGFRLEAMVNLLEFTELDINRLLAVSALGGLEVAGMKKKDLSQSIRFAYYAFTAVFRQNINLMTDGVYSLNQDSLLYHILMFQRMAMEYLLWIENIILTMFIV